MKLSPQIAASDCGCRWGSRPCRASHGRRPIRRSRCAIVPFTPGGANRHSGAFTGPTVVGTARPAVHHRKSTGGRRQYRHRGGRHAPGTATPCSWSARRPPSMLRFMTSSTSISSAILPRLRESSAHPTSCGERNGSGQDRSRVHRVRQGESRQNQHGVVGKRDFAPYCRRTVQDDGWRRHGARAVSRRRPRAH